MINEKIAKLKSCSIITYRKSIEQLATQLPELENVHKVQTVQKSTSKHKTNGITTDVSPLNDQ